MSSLPPRHVLTWPEHGVEMAFRLIPPGTFLMGSRGNYSDEEPVHRVVISHPFWLGETPVTQAQFRVWTRVAGIEHSNHFGGRPDHPAENLDWRQAIGFCAWLSQNRAPELPEGFPRACLPTEAEWEYACRAGTGTDYHTGDGEAALREAGWFGEGWDEGSTHPVRLKHANDFGLHDLHGNVWEWCHDGYDSSAYRTHPDGVIDPGDTERFDEWGAGLAHLTGSDLARVLRGGSWYNSASFCRSAYRFRYWPDVRNRGRGFRVCLVRGPSCPSGTAGPARAEAELGPETEAEGRGRSRRAQAQPRR